MSQDEDSKLDEAWRRASDADAGRPSAKTRAAILAEAAAAARRRQPAANAPRYWMRLVAGVAVVGVGVVLWRQTAVRLPGEAPVAAVTVTQETAQSADSGDAATAVTHAQPLPATQPSAPPAPASAPKASREESLATGSRRVPVADTAAQVPQESVQDFAQPPVANAPRAMEPQAPAAAPPLAVQRGAGEEARADANDEGEAFEEVQVTGARITPRPRAVGPRAPPNTTVRRPTQAGPAAEDLLRDHFPAQNASAQPHRLWVVLDAAGRVVRTGELAPGERPEDVATADTDRDAQVPESWRLQILSNARGQRIELAIGQLPR